MITVNTRRLIRIVSLFLALLLCVSCAPAVVEPVPESETAAETETESETDIESASSAEPAEPALTALPEVDAATVAAWRAETDERIAAIRATPSMDVGERTCYYISNSGSDENDGLTPETAWATLRKASAAPIGSAVLFERGGLFRGQLNARPNTVYSAYGEGPKPILCASPEDGADPAKWTQTPDDPTVWVYETVFREDVGTLVFDGGNRHAIKVVLKAGDDEATVTQSRHSGNCINMTWGTPFNDYHDLRYDLEMWHDDRDHKVYLKSVHNPGQRFSSIEFNVAHHVIRAQCDNVTIDNLCVKYGGCHGVGAVSANDLTVQNCEFGWIGGGIQYVEGNETVRFGNAIEVWCSCENYTVENCYIYQIYDAGVTNQYELDAGDITKDRVVNQTNVTYAHNVIEYCNYGIEYFLGSGTETNPSRIANFTIEDNHIWYAGTGFCEQRGKLGRGAAIKSWNHTNRVENFVIRDNRFIDSKDLLIHICSDLLTADGKESMPRLSGNLFAGRKGADFGVCSQTDKSYVPYSSHTPAYLAPLSDGDTFYLLPTELMTEVGGAPKSRAPSSRPRELSEWIVPAQKPRIS